MTVEGTGRRPMRFPFPVFDEVRCACFDVLTDAGIPPERLRETMRAVERQVFEEYLKLPEDDRTPHRLAWAMAARVADEGGDTELVEALRRKFFDQYGTPKR